MPVAPARVKSTITGTGRAEKQQMVRMIRMLLCLDDSLREDAADALALALTFLRRAPLDRALATGVLANLRRPARRVSAR